jgi:hypothetical protein
MKCTDTLDMHPSFAKQHPEQTGEKLLEKVEAAIFNLVASNPPPLAKANDVRHPSNKELTVNMYDILEQDKTTRCHLHDGSCTIHAKGIYRFAHWIPRGQGVAHNTTGGGAPLSDVAQGSCRFNAVGLFFWELAPLFQTMRILQHIIAPEIFDSVSQNSHTIGINQPAFGVLRTSRRAAFTGIAVLRIHSCAPHDDVSEDRTALCCKICLKDFHAGDLFLPELDNRLQYRRCDIVFFNSRRIMHYIGNFRGTRTAIVSCNHLRQQDILAMAQAYVEITQL